jgi:replicative DNA helicase
MNSKTKENQSNVEGNKETVQDSTNDLNDNETLKLFTDVVEEIDKNYKSKKEDNGINSGIEKLDCMLQGFREGDLNIIASRPAIGKTIFALSMFVNIIKQGKNALYISFEKYEKELLKNILSIITKVDTLRFDNGFITTQDYRNMLEGLNQLDKNSDKISLKTFINTDLIKLKKFIKEKIEKDKIKIVFIDYLTLIIPAPTYASRWEQVAEISRSLKSMAMEFKIPFIVLSPLHRNTDDNSPEITDISESGSIEYDADRVIILYKKQEKNKEDFYDIDKDCARITVYIAKNRRGTKGTFEMLFNYKNKIIAEMKN